MPGCTRIILVVRGRCCTRTAPDVDRAAPFWALCTAGSWQAGGVMPNRESENSISGNWADRKHAPSDSACRPAHGGYAAVVAVGQFLQRSALRAPFGGLFLLCQCPHGGGRPICFPWALARRCCTDPAGGAAG